MLSKKQGFQNLLKRRNLKIISGLILLIGIIFLNMIDVGQVLNVPLNNLKLQSAQSINSTTDANTATSNLKTSDVSGTDLYAEQISAFIAGGSSLIQQSFVTNDSNIFQGIDYNDPCFLECSVMIAASNGISPKMFPLPVGNSSFSSDNLYFSQSFFGFLYYNSSFTSNITLQARAQRAFEVLSNVFDIQIIPLNNHNMSNFYPFIGYYPDWKNVMNVITANAPSDGYWGDIDTARLTSQNYLQNKHLDTVILMLNSMDLLYKGLNYSQEFFNFDISKFSLDYLQGSQLTSILSGLFNVFNISSQALGSFNTQSFLNGTSKVITTILQYEGADSGIENLGDNNYKFDLMKAMDYDNATRGPLTPSSDIYLSLIGALLTEIDISIYSANVLSSEPSNLKLSSYLLNEIQLGAFLAGQNFNVSTVENYSLGIFWQSTDCVNQLLTNIQDVVNPQDPVNLIRLLGFNGFPMIPTGILNPLDNLTVNYNVNWSEPTLSIQKDYVLTSLATGSYNLKITVTNNGNTTAWGQEIGSSFFNISSIPIPGVLNTLIPMIYGESAQQYLFNGQNPRFFLIDTYGTGTYNSYYPNINSPGALTLYNPTLAATIMDPAYDYIWTGIPGGFAGLYSLFNMTAAGRQALANSLENPQSVLNPDNWKLDPGQNFSYTVTGQSLSQYYYYTHLYTFNFTVNSNSEPFLSYGNSEYNTTAINAQTSNGKYWDISSEQIGNQNIAQMYFSFHNDTNINLTNKNIDNIKFNAVFNTNLTGTNVFSNVQLEFYNFSAGTYGEFQTVPTNSLTYSNTSVSFSTLLNLTDYINSTDNYHSLFKLTFIANSPFLLSLGDVNTQIFDRNFTKVDLNPARLSYTTYSGTTTYTVQSNSVIAVTDNAPVLIVSANLAKQDSKPGELNSYYLNITNVGNREAKEVNISIPIPGIISNSGDFTLQNNTLMKTINNINAGESINNLTFQFYTPNSNLLYKAKIEYNNFRLLNPILNQTLNESSSQISNGTSNQTLNETSSQTLNETTGQTSPDFVIYCNDVFLSAPINYDINGKQPYVNLLSVNYDTNFPNANIKGGFAPSQGDFIQLTINVKNIGLTTINSTTIELPKNIEGFQVVQNTSLAISDLQPQMTKNITVILNKTNEIAFLYPSIDQVSGDQSNMTRILPNSPLVLGYIDANITKSLSTLDSVHNSLITVTIKVTNTGTLPMINFTINDITGFPSTGFTLESGEINRLVHKLTPGSSYTYSYVLKCDQQGIYNISSASISYNYLNLRSFESNSFTVKVRNNWIVNASWILLPSVLSLVIIGLIYWWKHRYDMESAEFERREELMFGQDFRSTAWDKYIIQEHMREVLEGKEISSKRLREEVY